MKWDNFTKNTVGEQIVEAADSIGANIAEVYGKGSLLDFKGYCKRLKKLWPIR